jgi:AAHS family 3-hydroxyphenylpropionic acid transporter
MDYLSTVHAQKPHARNSSAVILTLCGLAAIFEGFDTQSMGVAAPRVAQELSLTPAQLGIVFSAGTLGLFVGAAVGGRIADLIGRARTLAYCLLVFGLFSLLTTTTSGLHALVLVRVLTGLGLGGAMPTSIALASEATVPSRRLATTATLMAAMPLGGAITGLIALTDRWGWNWRDIFYLGGVGPLIVAAIVLLAMPSERRSEAVLESTSGEPKSGEVCAILFAPQRRAATLLLWVGFFFTQLLLLLMLNWLPSLMVGLGFTRTQASWGSVLFNLSGALGANALSRWHASVHQRIAVVAIYAGMIASLIALPHVGNHFLPVGIACAFTGIFIVGAQMILFALAPLFYPRADRATGTGAAVAAGRLGSVVGPALAGALLAHGGTSSSVFAYMLPFVLIAGSAVLALAWRPRSAD